GRGGRGRDFMMVGVDRGLAVGPGQRGDLWARGPQVIKGYLNNPEATAASIDGDGWFRTGDIAEVDEDGYVAIVDRVKELIKYKGYSVAPARLEGILIAHPAILDAAVIPSPDEEAGEVPKAFVVVKEPVSEEDIMAYVAEHVAPQERVRRVAFIEEVPKSASGKILRRVLIEQERAAAQ
ncbi:MAG: 4-coumarate--CoA ligase family protein, partial [Chloroflexi bacterium]|nr:4-coumarate--CoA ligase family protein [Chloroflexota bacterium]